MPDQNSVGGGAAIAAGDNVIGRVKITDGTDVADVIDNGTFAGLGVVILDAAGDALFTFPVSNAGLTELAAAINGSSQMDVNIAASGATVPVSNAGLTELAAAIDTEVQVDIVGALPAGTAYLGKTLPPDRDVTLHTNYAKKYYSASAPTDGIVWSPAGGTRWHVVSMFIGLSAAGTVTLEDDLAGGDSAVWSHSFAANGGMTINFGEHYPLASGEDAADLIVTATAGTVSVTVTGYEI